MEYMEKDFQMFQDIEITDRNMSVQESEPLEIKHNTSDPVEYAMEKVPEKRKKHKLRWFESCSKNDDHCPCCKQYPKFINSKNMVKKSETYKCFFCDNFCVNRESRKSHVENEHQDRTRKGLDGHWRYQCDFCHYESKIALFLYNHETRCSKSRIFKCEICEFGSSRKTNFIVHMKTIHQTDIPMFKRQPKPIFKCSHCDYKTQGKAKIRKHISNEHSQNTIQCDLCPFQTTQLRVFVKHQSLHNVGTFQCEVCSFQTQSELGFKGHVKIHENANNFQCEICSYQTESEIGLNSHRSNHDKVMVKCVKCDYESLTKVEMILHKKVHNSKYQETKCEKCGFCPQGPTLKIRIKRLGLHRCDPFKCEFCEFDSNLIGLVHQHKREKHKNELKAVYPCNVCSYKSKRKSNVVKHTQTVHDGFRISCQQCQKKFTQDSDLRHHMDSLHGVKFVSNKVKYLACGECGYKNKESVSKNHKCEPLKCQLCTFETRFEARMKTHMRKEHNEMQYNCPKCEYMTPKHGRLETHKLTLHEGFGSKLECSDCGIRVVTIFDLRRHFSTVHGANSSEELMEMNRKNN